MAASVGLLAGVRIGNLISVEGAMSSALASVEASGSYVGVGYLGGGVSARLPVELPIRGVVVGAGRRRGIR